MFLAFLITWLSKMELKEIKPPLPQRILWQQWKPIRDIISLAFVVQCLLFFFFQSWLWSTQPAVIIKKRAYFQVATRLFVVLRKTNFPDALEIFRKKTGICAPDALFWKRSVVISGAFIKKPMFYVKTNISISPSSSVLVWNEGRCKLWSCLGGAVSWEIDASFQKPSGIKACFAMACSDKPTEGGGFALLLSS